MHLSQMRVKPEERLRSLSIEDYRTAYKQGMNLSVYLESEDPSDQYNDGLDAFERLLKVSGIRTHSVPYLGIQADKFDAFFQSEQTRALIPEWVSRVFRRAASGRDVSTRAIFTTPGTPKDIIQPVFYDAIPRMTKLAPAIPLSELVAVTTGIDSATYESFYLTEPSAADKRLTRVPELAEISLVALTGGDHIIRLHKYARGIGASYEVLRRMPIDLLAIHLSRIAIQNEMDKVVAALSVLISGDGNSGTAATNSNQSTLDSAATPGTISLKGYLSWKYLFTNPYVLTTAITRSDGALQLSLLNLGSANIPLVTIAPQAGFGGFTPINPELADQVRLGVTVDAPANIIVGFDARFALQRIYEVGADLTEVERIVRNQSQAIYVSEVEGFAVLDATATRTYTYNA